MIETLEMLDQEGTTAMPPEIVDPLSREWTVDDTADIAFQVHRVVADHYPRYQQGKLSGLARIVMCMDDESRWFERPPSPRRADNTASSKLGSPGLQELYEVPQIFRTAVPPTVTPQQA